MDRYELVRHIVALVPNPNLKWPAMDVFDDVNLTLMLRQRKTPWAVCQSPLPRVVVNREAKEFNKRGSSEALRVVLVLRPRGPYACKIDLSKCRNAGKKKNCQKQ